MPAEQFWNHPGLPRQGTKYEMRDLLIFVHLDISMPSTEAARIRVSQVEQGYVPKSAKWELQPGRVKATYVRVSMIQTAHQRLRKA